MSNVIERLVKYAGLDFDKQRTPPNPNITVREAIEVADHIATLTAKLAEPEKQLAEAMKDAQRYRWLRDSAKSVDWSYWINGKGGAYYCLCRTGAASMDAAIDAAIRAMKDE